MSVCRLVIAGRIANAPELKSTAGGTAVLEFPLAWSTSKRNRDGEWEEESNFIDCSLFGSRAEGLAGILRKGMKVTCDGALRQSRWTASDGTGRSKHTFSVYEIELPDRQREPERQQGFADEEIPF